MEAPKPNIYSCTVFLRCCINNLFEQKKVVGTLKVPPQFVIDLWQRTCRQLLTQSRSFVPLRSFLTHPWVEFTLLRPPVLSGTTRLVVC